MRAPHPALALGVGAALLVAGCSRGAAEPAAEAPAPTTAARSTASPTGAGPTSSGTATSSPSPGSPTAGSTGSATAAATDLTSLGLQDRHPDGTTLQVTSVAVERTGIVVGVTVVNGYTDEIRLNSRGVFVQDDAGNGYNFREPAQNADLAVAPGAELVGELVFLGVLDPSATELTLKTNVDDAEDPVDTTNRYDRSTTPELLVTGIPLP